MTQQIPTQRIVIAGTKPTFAAAANGDIAEVGPECFMIVKNAAGSSMTTTLAVPGTLPNGIAAPDTVITVPATTGEVWIPLDTYYADSTAGGKVRLTYSTVTSVTVAVIRL